MPLAGASHQALAAHAAPAAAAAMPEAAVLGASGIQAPAEDNQGPGEMWPPFAPSFNTGVEYTIMHVT